MARRRKRPGGFSRVEAPLQRLLQRVDPERRIDAYRLWSFWDAVVGENIARRAQPERIRNDVLFVTVAGSVWMQELQFLKDSIRERINERLGAPLIKDIYLVSGRVPEPDRGAEEPPVSLPVAVPDLPPTGIPELDASLLRIAHATARRDARGQAPRPPKK